MLVAVVARLARKVKDRSKLCAQGPVEVDEGKKQCVGRGGAGGLGLGGHEMVLRDAGPRVKLL